jgi:molybdate transport system permease protein
VPETHLGLTGDDWRAVWLSTRIAAAAVVLSLPLGLGCGWLLARKQFFGKAALETVIALPLVLPPVVTGLLLLYALGPHSPVGAWLRAALGVDMAFTWRAAVLAVAVVGFPLLVRSVRIAFEGVDPRLYQVARSLGARRLDAFWSVSLPLARHGVIAGVVLAFARGRPETTTLAIQIYLLHNQPGDTSELRMWRVVLASLVLAFASVVASEYLARRGRTHDVH